MRVQRGFTIIELIITLVVMGILLVLGIVDLTSSQAKSRDSERQADISNISSALESYYTAGSDATDGSGSVAATDTYPVADNLVGSTSGTPNALSLLRDLDSHTLSSPNGGTGVNGIALVGLANPATFDTCLDNNGGTSAALTCVEADANAPSASKDNYLYVPYTQVDSNADYHYCGATEMAASVTGECTGYSLFYWSETNNAVQEVDGRHDA